jgi:putative transcriptional regulator
MTKLYESLMEGLHEAIEFAGGKDTGAIIHHINVPTLDFAQIKAQTGLSQSDFAKSIGVAKGTMLNREHGSRHPTGPAQVLLAMIAPKPSVVSELLGP